MNIITDTSELSRLELKWRGDGRGKIEQSDLSEEEISYLFELVNDSEAENSKLRKELDRLVSLIASAKRTFDEIAQIGVVE